MCFGVLCFAGHVMLWIVHDLRGVVFKAAGLESVRLPIAGLLPWGLDYRTRASIYSTIIELGPQDHTIYVMLPLIP